MAGFGRTPTYNIDPQPPGTGEAGQRMIADHSIQPGLEYAGEAVGAVPGIIGDAAMDVGVGALSANAFGLSQLPGGQEMVGQYLPATSQEFGMDALQRLGPVGAMALGGMGGKVAEAGLGAASRIPGIKEAANAASGYLTRQGALGGFAAGAPAAVAGTAGFVGGMAGGDALIGEAGQALASGNPRRFMDPAPGFDPTDSNSIMAMQQFLSKRGAKMKVDGEWGPESQGKLKKYNATHNSPEVQALLAKSEKTAADAAEAERLLKLQQAKDAEFARQQGKNDLLQGAFKRADDQAAGVFESTKQGLAAAQIPAAGAMGLAQGVGDMGAHRSEVKGINAQGDSHTGATGRPIMSGSKAQKRGFVDTYDKVTAKRPGFGGKLLKGLPMYGALAGEAYGTGMLRDKAENTYQEKLKQFQKGPGEEYLADEAAQARRQAQLYGDLQSAAAPSALAYTLGKGLGDGGAKMASPAVSPEATAARGAFAADLTPKAAPPKAPGSGIKRVLGAMNPFKSVTKKAVTKEVATGKGGFGKVGTLPKDGGAAAKRVKAATIEAHSSKLTKALADNPTLQNNAGKVFPKKLAQQLGITQKDAQKIISSAGLEPVPGRKK
jgi:hypothetical protein